MANSKEREQISVPIDAELRAAIERAAKAEHRTVASLVRHLVAQALEHEQTEAMTDHPLFAASRAMLKTTAELLDRLEAQVAAVQSLADQAEAARAAMADERLEHEQALAAMTQQQISDHQARQQELRVQEAALWESQRAVDEKDLRADAKVRMAEMRAADLSNRLHGIGAA
jgi:hypothetical protein